MVDERLKGKETSEAEETEQAKGQSTKEKSLFLPTLVLLQKQLYRHSKKKKKYKWFKKGHNKD